MYIYVMTCDNPVLFKLGGSNPTSQNQLYLYKHYSQRLGFSILINTDCRIINRLTDHFIRILIIFSTIHLLLNIALNKAHYPARGYSMNNT